MERIYVVGTTGSGKTTLARALSIKIGAPHVELDALYWQPDWTAPDNEAFRDAVLVALSTNRWVVEGNYKAVRDDIMARIDTLVWLDYPLPFVFGRLLRRTIIRIGRREVLWNGNRESLIKSLSSRSILLWCLQTHRKRRKMYAELTPALRSRGVIVHHFTSARDTESWLRSL